VIVLALLTFAPGGMGGSEEVVRTLTGSLAEYGTRAYRVLAPPDAVDVANGLPVAAAGVSGSASRPLALLRAMTSGGALDGADVVHYPFTIPVPRPRRPHIVTLHDVLHLDHPELVPRTVRTFRLWAYDRASREADRVIVPSAFVRDRAVARLGLDRSRIRVIHHAVDTTLFYPPNESTREPFVLYPARPWPHKNHALLFEAFAQVRKSRPELELVLTGGGHDALRLPDAVRSLGLVPRAELADLYRRASALVFPSRYEGFGLPILEAMASALPVAAASSGAIEEVADETAVMFSPDSAQEAATAILGAIDAGPDLVRKGIDVAYRFTREKVAAAHDEVYAELE
jgi:glycosyltransferase involved in cell wall biosynthesis